MHQEKVQEVYSLTKKYNYYIDLSSSNTGVVLVNNDNAFVTSWKFNYKPHKDVDKYHQHIYKLKYISQYIHEFIKRYPPQEIFIEGPFIQTRFLASSEILLKLHGLIIEIFKDYEIHQVAPKTIKKIITGNGNATKDEVFEVIKKTFNFTPNNKDESDALAVMLYFYRISQKSLPQKIQFINT